MRTMVAAVAVAVIAVLVPASEPVRSEVPTAPSGVAVLVGAAAVSDPAPVAADVEHDARLSVLVRRAPVHADVRARQEAVEASRAARRARYAQHAEQRRGEEAAREAALEEAERVSAFQQQLAVLGWHLGEVDGEQGEETTSAVRQFQAAAGLGVDGIVGPQTQAALDDDGAITREQAEARRAEQQAAAAAAEAEAEAQRARDSSAASSGASSGASRLDRVTALADASGFDWRSRGVALHVGCHPRWRCAWGLYDSTTRQVWVGPDAFASQARLRYVVLHELAHAWQHSTGDMAARDSDLAGWGLSGKQGREAAADCVAALWGATSHHYWPCPSDARSHMASVLAATS